MELILIILGIMGLNIVDIYIMLEILIMGCTLSTIWISSIVDDITGLMYSLMQIIVGGIESSIGLGILVRLNKIRVSDEISLRL